MKWRGVFNETPSLGRIHYTMKPLLRFCHAVLMCDSKGVAPFVHFNMVKKLFVYMIV